MIDEHTEPIENIIEAALFFSGGSLAVKDLSRMIGEPEERVREGIDSLTASLIGRGIRVVRERDSVALATAPAHHEMIEQVRRNELEGPLGRAGLETLAVIIFRGPLARSDVEYVRGVNCSTILRSLLIRGLIERIENPSDKRGFLYQATTELPAHLGVGQLSDIPGYADMRRDIDVIFESRDSELKESAQDNVVT